MYIRDSADIAVVCKDVSVSFVCILCRPIELVFR